MEAGMLIAFVGPKTTRRLWPGQGGRVYEFSRWTGFSQEVESAEDCAQMLTHPRGEFAVDDDEPLLAAGMDADHAGLLALNGIANIEALAELDAAEASRLAKELRVKRTVVERWMAGATKWMVDVGRWSRQMAEELGGLEKRG